MTEHIPEPDDSSNTKTAKENTRGGQPVIKGLILAILDYWKTALIALVAGLGITLASNFWKEAIDWTRAKYYGFDDSATAIKYARMTQHGSKTVAALGYYDIETGKQYIAATYKIADNLNIISAFEIRANTPYQVGASIKLTGIQTELNSLEGENLIRANLHFFGFAHLKSNKETEELMLYGVERQFTSGGERGVVYLSPIDSNIIFTAEDSMYSGVPFMRPQFSTNITYDSVKEWLARKSLEILTHGDDWTKLPSGAFHNGLLDESYTFDWFPAFHAKKWFEENGIDRFDGDIKIIPITDKNIEKDIRERSVCTITIDNDTWMVPFKGPVMKFDERTKTLYLAYMQDPRNLREAEGIINGKHYLWFAISQDEKPETYYLTMRKSDNKFVKIKATVISNLPSDNSELDNSDNETDVSEENAMEEPPPLKDITHLLFKLSEGKVFSDGDEIKLHLPAMGGITDDSELFKDEFSQATNCVPSPKSDAPYESDAPDPTN
ncbi:hypothetical protein [Pseudomonas botevensis]|uniref:hypothetical protein n=1 Tax=Pseudomonas botevensis TaxID=2842352 RepID=UPI001C3CD857|nr:hypothetical protein [Pseudomonas botevensis]MBV4476847.1 hypothetical protein [Pseudomonas botevensis]